MDNNSLVGSGWLGFDDDFNNVIRCSEPFPIWNWQCDRLFGVENMIMPPFSPVTSSPVNLDQSTVVHSTQNICFQDHLPSLFDDEDLVEFENVQKNKMMVVKDTGDHDNQEQGKAEQTIKRTRDQEKAITYEEISRYFCMPITQAAKELNMGLTLLKKKCRQLGIPRWPHRKMKSLQTLINNVQEFGKEEEEEQLKCAVEILEQEKISIQKEPTTQLEEKTKRLRQAYFKAIYKKRRLTAGIGVEQTNLSCSSSACNAKY